MKQKLFCFLLTVCLLVGLLPSAVFAGEAEIPTEETEVTVTVRQEETDGPVPCDETMTPALPGEDEEDRNMLPAEDEPADPTDPDGSAEPSDSVGVGDETPTPTPNSEEEVETVPDLEGFVSLEDDGGNSGELLNAYVQQLFSSAGTGMVSAPALMSSDIGGNGLTGQDRRLYELLKPEISEIAAGHRTSTVITVPVNAILEKNRYTAEELGLEAITKDNASQIYKRIFTFSAQAVVNALLADCPYELYWYNKTVGTGYVIPGFTIYNSGSYLRYSDDKVLKFSFTVAGDYAGEVSYTTNPARVSAAAAALECANQILEDAAGLSDYEKLRYYLQQICDLTDYNYYASGGGADYGDPWQLVYVFDGDSSTNVVCEGYAKAFQYLCERSFFQSPDVYSILITGSIPAGGHMWNIVHMEDGGRYLVDLTNCDGYANRERLFLVPAYFGSVTSSYTVLADNSTMIYRYDEQSRSVYGQEELTLSTTPYHNYLGELTPPTCTDPGYTIYTCTRCGESYIADETPPTDHDLQPGESVRPTATQQGYTVYHCTHCGTTENRDFTSLLAALSGTLEIPHGGTAFPTTAAVTDDGYQLHPIRWEDNAGNPCAQPFCATDYSVTFVAVPENGYVLADTDLALTLTLSDGTVCLAACTLQENGTALAVVPLTVSHCLQYFSAREPGVAEEGWHSHYRCTDCDCLFADADAEQELTRAEVFLPGLPLATPRPVSAVLGADGVAFSWTNVESAEEYTVYRKTVDGTWQPIAVVPAEDGTYGKYIDNEPLTNGVTYIYTVRAHCRDEVSEYVAAGAAVTYIPAPVFRVANATDGILISWDEVAGATDYTVYRRTVLNSTWKPVGSTISGLSFTDTDVHAAETYTYTVRANRNGFSCYDGNGLAMTFLQTPLLQSAVNVSDGVSLHWDAVEGADSYILYRRTDGSAWAVLATETGTSLTDRDVCSGTTYTYTVRAYHAAGEYLSSYYPAGRTTRWLEQPEITKGSCVAVGVQLIWDPVPGAESYNVYRRSNGTSWAFLGNTNANSFTDTTASNSTNTYTIRACGGVYMSDYNVNGYTVSYVPTPTLSAVQNCTNGILFTWNAVPDAESYYVYRRSTGSWDLLDIVTDTSYLDPDSGLVSGTRYTYTVRACNRYSNTLGGYDAQGKTVNWLSQPVLRSAAGNSANVTISWEPVSNAQGYFVYRRIPGTSSWRYLGQTASTGFSDNTAKSGTVYTYTVRAWAGSSMSYYYVHGVEGCRLDTPQLLSAKQVYTDNGGAICLTWSAVPGNVPYHVYRRVVGGSWSMQANCNGTEWTDTDLKSGQTYCYTVRAYYGGSLSGFDATGLTCAFLQAPTDLQAVGEQAGIRFSWSATADAESYYVYRRASGSSWTHLAILPAEETTYLDENATPGTTCTYTVRAQRNGVLSAYSVQGASAGR